jgi:hypothetical protein
MLNHLVGETVPSSGSGDAGGAAAPGSELRGQPRLRRATGVAGPANLPRLFCVALDFPYPVASEIFDQHTHFMPPRIVDPGRPGRKKVDVLVMSP